MGAVCGVVKIVANLKARHARNDTGVLETTINTTRVAAQNAAELTGPLARQPGRHCMRHSNNSSQDDSSR